MCGQMSCPVLLLWDLSQDRDMTVSCMSSVPQILFPGLLGAALCRLWLSGGTPCCFSHPSQAVELRAVHRAAWLGVYRAAFLVLMLVPATALLLVPHVHG